MYVCYRSLSLESSNHQRPAKQYFDSVHICLTLDSIIKKHYMILIIALNAACHLQ